MVGRSPSYGVMWGGVEETVLPSDTITLLGVESTADQCTLRVLTCLAGRLALLIMCLSKETDAKRICITPRAPAQWGWDTDLGLLCCLSGSFRDTSGKHPEKWP